jgi:hypothetical protein
MFQMAVKYINIFQSKALQYLPKIFIFWFENKPSGIPGVEGAFYLHKWAHRTYVRDIEAV